MNRRSVAIAFDADYENGIPSIIELEAAAKITKQYLGVSKGRILGHCEVNPKTTCPSKLFLCNGDEQGWKDALLALIET